MRHLFPNHRHIKRRYLRDAAFGCPTTASAYIVWLLAFASLWLVILRGVEEDNPQRWVANLVETGNYAIAQLESYRSENGGKVPESLECFGFSRGGYRNTYYIQLPRHGYRYSIEYVKIDDTSYYIGFNLPHTGKGQYLSTTKRWRIAEFEQEYYKRPYLYEGEDISPVFLYEYKLEDYLDTIKLQLESLVDSKAGKQQYMLVFLGKYDTVSTPFTIDFKYNADSLCTVAYNLVLQTYDPMLYPDADLFTEAEGYCILNGHVCYIVDKTWFAHRFIFKRTDNGRIFTLPDNRGCIGGERYWYLDLDGTCGAKLELKGVYAEE